MSSEAIKKIADDDLIDDIKLNLMKSIKTIIIKNKWTRQKAAEVLSISAPRLSNIYHGKTELFTIDFLSTMLTKLNRKIVIQVKKGIMK